MYVQKRKAGIKEFLLAILMILGATLVYDAVRFFLPGVPLLKEIVLIGLCCWLVYLLYQHYAATFEYKLDAERFYAERRTGHKIKTISFSKESICGVQFGKKPAGLTCRNACVRILPNKKTCYIIYEKDKVLACEPDGELARLLEECVHDKHSRRTV